MSAATSLRKTGIKDSKVRYVSEGDHPGVLSDIYQEEVNISVWQRDVDSDLSGAVNDVLAANSAIQVALTVSPESCLAAVNEALQGSHIKPLCEDIAELVDMFCFLFDLKRTGLRLTALSHAMCPRFHVDRVPCRLVSTYSGTATEWLPHALVDRSKLGRGNNGKSDEESGLFSSRKDIHRLNQGDVALLKGESWLGNENAGLVHRSPQLQAGEQRLLLTLDFVD